MMALYLLSIQYIHHINVHKCMDMGMRYFGFLVLFPFCAVSSVSICRNKSVPSTDLQYHFKNAPIMTRSNTKAILRPYKTGRLKPTVSLWKRTKAMTAACKNAIVLPLQEFKVREHVHLIHFFALLVIDQLRLPPLNLFLTVIGSAVMGLLGNLGDWRSSSTYILSIVCVISAALKAESDGIPFDLLRTILATPVIAAHAAGHREELAGGMLLIILVSFWVFQHNPIMLAIFVVIWSLMRSRVLEAWEHKFGKVA